MDLTKESFDEHCQKNGLRNTFDNNFPEESSIRFWSKGNYINYIFELSCLYGYIETAKWLYYNFRNIISLDCINETLMSGILHNNIDIVKWLLTLSFKDTPLYNQARFKLCCKYGYIELAKILLNKTLVNLDCYGEEIFEESCEEGHKNAVEYMMFELGFYKSSICKKYPICHEILIEYLIHQKNFQRKRLLMNLYTQNGKNDDSRLILISHYCFEICLTLL